MNSRTDLTAIDRLPDFFAHQFLFISDLSLVLVTFAAD